MTSTIGGGTDVWKREQEDIARYQKIAQAVAAEGAKKDRIAKELELELAEVAAVRAAQVEQELILANPDFGAW